MRPLQLAIQGQSCAAVLWKCQCSPCCPGWTRHACPAGGEGLGEVVRWLRQERETARQELALSQQEAHRLRQDSARHQREAAAALAEAQAIRERTHKEVQGREEHQAHLGRLDQLNLLRESNTTLRWGPCAWRSMVWTLGDNGCGRRISPRQMIDGCQMLAGSI